MVLGLPQQKSKHAIVMVADALHSFVMLLLGVKMDEVPGRLNQKLISWEFIMSIVHKHVVQIFMPIV